MKTYLNKITGISDAIVSMFLSKRSWTREKEIEIYDVCDRLLDVSGRFVGGLNESKISLQNQNVNGEDVEKFNKWLASLTKFGQKHITMLRFIDLSVTVEGLHRGGQDDWDSHAKRFDNRIIRSSTRLATFDNEMSDWYTDKVIPTDKALEILGITAPAEITFENDTYVKSINGYIKKEFADNKDVKRGLYMLSIPSNFIFKINLTEWSHIYKERGNHSGANPEVKLVCEDIQSQLESAYPMWSREYLLSIIN
ncbi:MAG: hypothetical protein LBL93_05125 [Ruminococcus sp.]|jgi:hypothetical protein|nr:hypothetical protein [Ruminococcus sp.]